MGSKREGLKLAISRITRRAGRGESLPNVDELAIRLSSKYPQSGMTLNEICSEIAFHLEKENDRVERGECSS